MSKTGERDRDVSEIPVIHFLYEDEKFGPVDVALSSPEASDSKLRCSRPGVLTRTAGGRIPGRKLRKRRPIMMRRLVERRERLKYLR